MKTLHLIVPDIMCAGCLNSIREALGVVPGVKQIDGDIEAKHVRVTYLEEEVTPETIRRVITDAGFSPR